jgi:hypothetical protein
MHCGGRVEIAVGRFNRAFSRESAEDRLIDLWVGLESLFSPTERQELTYRIALRAAFHVVDDPALREDTHRLLVDSYYFRSGVVHGGGLKGKTEKLKIEATEALRRTSECLRVSLLKILLVGSSFDATNIDGAILRGDNT